MKKTKFIIIGIIIIITIIIIIVLSLFYLNSYREKYTEENFGRDDGDVTVVSSQVEKVTSSTYFFTVEECINTYLSYLTATYDEFNAYLDSSVIGIESEEDKKNAIYSVLDKQYVEENDISLDNILQNVDTYNNGVSFQAQQMNFIEGENINTYAVIGDISEGLSELNTKCFIVALDKNNTTFSITPIKETDLKEIDLKLKTEDIEKNTFNIFTYIRPNNEDIIKKYFSNYKLKAHSNIDEAYNLLDEEYREKRFGSVDSFNEYIQNDENFNNSYSSQYQVNTYDGYTQYLCIDQNGKYYIFNERAIMDYDVILDTYTVDLPQFLEQYNEASGDQKAYMDVQKVYEAINNKDYNYVYNKLDNSFKQNNFATLEKFERYVQESFLENTEIEGSVKVSDSGQYYICTVQTINNDTGEQKEETIIIKLNEGTDFVMSFTVEE